MKKRILSLATVLFIGGAVVLTSCGKDEEAPIITLKGDAIEKIELGSTYSDAGVTADDNEDGDVSANVTNDSETAVNNKKAGKYTVTYTVSDEKGNTGTATREVWVVISPKVLVGSFSCISKSAAGDFPYTDNVSLSSTSTSKCLTSKFDGYTDAAVTFELTGDLGETVTIASQTVNCGTGVNKKDRTFSGNGTVALDGKSVSFSYSVKSDSGTDAVTNTYTKQ